MVLKLASWFVDVRSPTACRGVSHHEWYFPPADIFEKLVNYANEYGDHSGCPYFSLDGTSIATGSQWEQMRAKFSCPVGVTNVWSEPSLRGKERVKVKGKAVHPNQKPLKLMERIIKSSTDEGDAIWEPFAGLASASIAAASLSRLSFAAEINEKTYDIASERIDYILNQVDLFA